MIPVKQPHKPYAFQARAQKIVLEKFECGITSEVLVSPTGSGKTNMAGWIMQAERFRTVRCISHRVSINEQNAKILCPTFTPQSLQDGVPEGFGKPDLVIWEEAHNSEAPTYKAVRRWFPKAILLGLTATPQRSDGLALDLFEDMTVAAHYSELLLNKTIVPCEVVVPDSFYEDQEPDLAYAYLDGREPGDRAFIFCKSIEDADGYAKRLKRVQPYHCGRTPKENLAALDGFKSGALEALTTVDSLSEGIDVPEASLLVLGQKCDNLKTYLQRSGRILRAAPGKRRAKVIDCVGASMRHGRPTEDRIYSIRGTGIQRRGGHQAWDYDREYTGRKELKPYRAKFRTLFGWQNPTPDDKRRQLGWLRAHAAQHGYTEDVAAQCFYALFGEEPESQARRSSPPSSRIISTKSNGKAVGA